MANFDPSCPGKFLALSGLLALALASTACQPAETMPLTLPEYGHTPLALPPEPAVTEPTPAPLISDAPKPIQGVATTPIPADVLKISRAVADWQLDHPSTEAKTGWVNAAFFTGAMALGRIVPDTQYFDAMQTQGMLNNWQLGTRSYNADDHAVAQMYLELFEVRKDPVMLTTTKQRFDFVLDNPQDDNLDFTLRNSGDHWSWCDSLFMDPPAWARLAKITSQQKYLDSANRRWWVTSDFLYDKDEHLFYRDSTFFTKREPNGQKVFWARGNGWVIAGLVRMLDYMSKDYPDRGKYVRELQDMAAKIKSLQQPDGLWRSGLLDPADHPQQETSGSGFFTYALAWGINQGVLDRAEYTPVVLKAWSALTQCVQADGKLTHVQPVGAAPNGFAENSTAPFGVGSFLLAGSEVYQMVGGKLPDESAVTSAPTSN